MKKLSTVVLAVLLVFSLVACSNTHTDYDALVAERDALLAENENLKANLAVLQNPSGEPSEPKTGIIHGYFIATVRDLIPGYTLDETTPFFVVATMFQDSPFTIYLGPDLIDQVEVGKQYKFVIQDTEVDLQKYPAVNEMLYPPEALSALNISLASVAPASDEEGGLESTKLELSLSE